MNIDTATFEIDISQDIEAKEFKENFFYHFDKGETFSLAVALTLGGATYFVLNSYGLGSNAVTFFMALAAIFPLLLGFYKNQGYGFLEHIRRVFMVKAFDEVFWESTEDSEKIYECKGRRQKISELDKKDPEDL